MEAYILSTTTRLENQAVTGWDLRGVAEWVGDYLFRNLFGNMLSFMYEYRYWFIVLLIMAGVIGIVKRAFTFYNTRP